MANHASKAPAHQWYPRDYLADEKTMLMTLEQEGAYIRLLCHAWLEGSIPADEETLARLVGKGATTTLVRVVKGCFTPSPIDPSRMVHPRLEIERKKQKEWREKSSAGGQKSAKRRGMGKNKGGARVVQPNGNSSSSSSSAELKNKESAVFDEQVLAVLNGNGEEIPAGAPPDCRRRGRRPTKTPVTFTPDQKQLFDEARDAHPGKKRGVGPELEDFLKKYGAEAFEILPKLLPAARAYAAQCEAEGREKKYIQHFKTWIAQQGWTVEPDEPQAKPAMAGAYVPRY